MVAAEKSERAGASKESKLRERHGDKRKHDVIFEKFPGLIRKIGIICCNHHTVYFGEILK